MVVVALCASDRHDGEPIFWGEAVASVVLIFFLFDPGLRRPILPPENGPEYSSTIATGHATLQSSTIPTPS